MGRLAGARSGCPGGVRHTYYVPGSLLMLHVQQGPHEDHPPPPARTVGAGREQGGAISNSSECPVRWQVVRVEDGEEGEEVFSGTLGTGQHEGRLVRVGLTGKVTSEQK